MMSTISLKDILINARQEAVQLRHYYLGVEHLFLAMLQIHNGFLVAVMESRGYAVEPLVNAIRDRVTQGSEQLLWAGFRYTPRSEVVLDIAKDLAVDNESEEITERELLLAILMEGDNLPVRAMRLQGIEASDVLEAARTYETDRVPQLPDIPITYGSSFDTSLGAIEPAHLALLRRMFPGHHSIRLDRRLTGFSGAFVVVATPIQSDGNEGAPVVVKIHDADSIRDEFARYEMHVKAALPLQTARLEDPPEIPDGSQWGALKYTLVAVPGTNLPLDLRTQARQHGMDGIAALLKDALFERFKPTWWQQRKPYRFQVWQEYDWLLPPLITLDIVADGEALDTPVVLKPPTNRQRLRERLSTLRFGSDVILEHFTVQRHDRRNNVLKLSVSFGSEAENRAYRVDVRGINALDRQFHRGEVVERLAGTVWKTRKDTLHTAVRDLEPDFDMRSHWIPISSTSTQVLNPIHAYDELLDRHVNGTISRIHGDMHLGNIIVGPNNSVWMIDFGHTRNGHTLFDWAVLEISLLADAMMPWLDDSWENARTIIELLQELDDTQEAPPGNGPVAQGLTTIAAVRRIARECLRHQEDWYEYYIALSLTALRGIEWPTLTLGARRLLLLVAGLAMLQINRKYPSGSTLETLTSDNTLTDRLPNRVRHSESKPDATD